jgi:hypothetical protein
MEIGNLEDQEEAEVRETGYEVMNWTELIQYYVQ